MPKKLTKQQFVEKANKVHQHRYDYTSSIYVGSNEPITIMCLTHGYFNTTPKNHIHGKCGCPECKRLRTSKQHLIDKANKTHCDYSLVPQYINTADKIKIICEYHGAFEQIVANHMYLNSDCPQCSRDNLSKTKGEFIQIANEIHKNKYNYSLIDNDIIKSHTSLHIICNNHGIFNQTAQQHLKHGCAKCNRKGRYHKDTIFENTYGHFYILLCENNIEQFLKIGITKQNVNARMSNIKNYNSSVLFKKRLHLHHAYTIEQQLLASLRHWSYTPKIKFGGHTECMYIESLDAIKNEVNKLCENI